MPDSPGAVTEVSIHSNPYYLDRIRRITGCLAGCVGMSVSEIDDAKLALSEACANAIRHGSPQGQSDRVIVRFSSAGGALIAEVADRGGGFDPDDLPGRSSAEPGGLGIPLMRALTDELEFLRNSKGMVVRLVKRARAPRPRLHRAGDR